MRSDTTQQPLPLKPKTTAAEWRIAAESALRNPFETPAQCQRRHDYYLQQAQACEQRNRG